MAPRSLRPALVSGDARISLEHSVGHVKGLSSHAKTQLDSFIRFHKSPTFDREKIVSRCQRNSLTIQLVDHTYDGRRIVAGRTQFITLS